MLLAHRTLMFDVFFFRQSMGLDLKDEERDSDSHP